MTAPVNRQPSVNADVFDIKEQERRNALFVLDVLVRAYVPKNTPDRRECEQALATLRAATPQRIQLSRSKGWRMPENTVKVSRPSRWGNVYPVAVFGRELAIALFRNTVQGCWSPSLFDGRSDDLIDRAYQLHCEFRSRHSLGDVLELRGKNVACFCALDEACHGDVLLELSNA